jgi:glycosyltransferase involved in cell wall biosynthesis
MSQAPLVSIVTPAYNSAAFIGDTINGALAQTCTDFELIVVDDGSTDKTIEAVHAAANGDPRVVVLRAAHGGQAAARNRALAIARGQYIALLDSDDVWMPHYLASQIALLERYADRAIVTANAINLGGPLDGRPLWPSTLGRRELSLLDLILEEDAVCIMTVFRRSVFDRIGGIDPRFTGNEDYEYWIRAANAGFGILRNHRPLGYYRRRDGSVSADDIRMLDGIISVLGHADRMTGLGEHERAAIRRQIERFRQEKVKVQMRSSLAKNDAATAALGLKTLSELRGSFCLAVAARLSMMWPHLLRLAYDWRRTLRAQ